MGFPQSVQDEALVASGRCCCICHKFCGTKINLHHIIQRADGGEDSFENCIPLCFDCHEDMGKPDPRHSTGKHYSPTELKMHRDNWYSCVKGGNTSVSVDICGEDKELFKRICALFTEEIRFWLKTGDFRSLIPTSFSEELGKILRMSEKPENEFINVELEKLLANLFQSLRTFKHFLSMDTYVEERIDGRFLASQAWLLNHGKIKPQKMEHNDDDGWIPDEEDLEFEEPEDETDEFVYFANYYEAKASRLNRYAGELWKSFDEFVRLGRRIVNTR